MKNSRHTGIASRAPVHLCRRGALVALAAARDYIASTAKEHGFDEAELTNLFTRIQPKPHILAFFERPSTGRPWHEFRATFVNPQRANTGAAFWRANEKALQEISQAYQVDPA